VQDRARVLLSINVYHILGPDNDDALKCPEPQRLRHGMSVIYPYSEISCYKRLVKEPLTSFFYQLFSDFCPPIYVDYENLTVSYQT
jgi:hypothetical protein